MTMYCQSRAAAWGRQGLFPGRGAPAAIAGAGMRRAGPAKGAVGGAGIDAVGGGRTGEFMQPPMTRRAIRNVISDRLHHDFISRRVSHWAGQFASRQGFSSKL